MKYYDFDIWIGPQTGDHYATRAKAESLGDKQGTILLAELDQLRVVLDQLSGGAVDEASLKQAGGSLFSILFAGPIGSLYQQALGQVYTDVNAGVRIRLRIEPPELATLPWELLHDSGRDCFLATSSETLLTRYIELSKPIRELQTALPIRILVIIPDSSGSNVEKEKQTILGALEGLGGAVQVQVLAGKVSSTTINRELVLKQYHILHFIGHGKFRDNTACLSLSGEQSGEDLIAAREFSYYFQDYPCMKLIVLNSCGGAEISAPSLTDVAQELVRAGVPAVIARRGAGAGEATKRFAEDFYLNLCLGHEKGRVDIAVSHARRRMVAGWANTDEFARSALFMRTPKGVIFDLSEGEVITTQRELDTAKAVARTRDYNIAQLKKEGGEEAGIAKEAEAQSMARAQVLQFYKRIALSAAPRVAMLALVLALVVIFASQARILNALRVDDYLGGALRLWSDVPSKPLNRKVRIILASRDDNGGLGSPVDNPGWRAYHTKLLQGFAAATERPRVVVFDVRFNHPTPDLDPAFAAAIRTAKCQNIQVVGGQDIDNDGQKIPGTELNAELQPAFGNSWGDVEVGGLLYLPLLMKGDPYVNQYEIASLQPNDSTAGGEQPVVPSLALQAVMQRFADGSTPPRAYFDEGANEVIIKAVDSGRPFEKHIPVTRQDLSLYMLLENAPDKDIQSNTNEYKDVYQWTTSTRPEEKNQLDLLFRDAIVLIGYDTGKDSHAVIGAASRAGVKIHANAVSNILNDAYIPEISRRSDVLIIIAMFALGVFLQTYLRRLIPGTLHLKLPFISNIIGEINVPVLFFAAIIAYCLVAYLLYSRSRVSFDMSYHIAALLFGYLLIHIFRKRLRLTEVPREERHAHSPKEQIETSSDAARDALDS